MKTSLSRAIYLATILIFTATITFSQNYKADVSKGDFALKKGDYEAASKFYAEAIKTIPTLGKSNLDILYKLGFSQMQIKNYSKASYSFSQYINIAKNTSAELNNLKDIIQWKEWCDNENNNQQSKNPVINTETYLTNMRGLNSSLNDMSITLDSRNEIIFFTSNKVFFDDKKLIDIKTNLFSSEIQSNELKVPFKIGAEINALGEIISACLCSDNKTLYFTVANNDQTKTDIYVCQYKSGKFEKPEKLPKIINSKYFDGYPSVSNDGKSLYFVSDRPGGFGGKDIYVTRFLPDKTWSQPFNLGKSVNTKNDEITPHIDKSNETIYFSSKGHPGNGGFDIFYSNLTNRSKWGEPINMVEPINSKSDDIAYITTTDNNVSYFSSSRKGGMGNFDIYKAGKTNPDIPEEKPMIVDINDIPQDSTTKPIEFDEFKKLAEKENQPQPIVNQPVITENVIVPTTIETPKTNIETQKKEQPVVQKPQVIAQQVIIDQPTTKQNEVITDKPISKQNNVPVVTEQVIKNPTQPNVVQRPKNNLPINKDTAILNATMRGLVFRVQLGAFRNHITVNSSYFEKLNKKILQEELSPEMYYKYTISTFESISKATNAKMALRESGYPDAFLACYFNGTRITMDEVLIMLDKKVYERMALNQK